MDIQDGGLIAEIILLLIIHVLQALVSFIRGLF